MDAIWHTERVRWRVKSSVTYQYVHNQTRYPMWIRGIWHSDLLDHWVQIPMVKGAMYAIEKDGGIDNFILNRRGENLFSKYGERLRRHLIVRQNEISKNFVLEKHARHLSEMIAQEVREAKTKDDLEAIREKYSLSANFVGKLQERLTHQVEVEASA